jgi:hypothetical protein
MALLLVVLAGCAKKQKVVQGVEECIAARDAAQRAAASCERCCVTPPLRK